MADKKNATRQGFNGVRYALENDTRFATYQAGLSGQVPLRLYTDGAGTTNATGGVTFTLPSNYFTVVYGAVATAVRNSADPTMATFAMVRSWSSTSVVVQVFESKTSGVLLGGIIEGLEASGAGIPVQLMVFGTG